MKPWQKPNKASLFWVWGILFAPAFLLIPGIGPVRVGGLLASWLLGGLETAVCDWWLNGMVAHRRALGFPMTAFYAIKPH